MRRLLRGIGGAPADGGLRAEVEGCWALGPGCLWRCAVQLDSCSAWCRWLRSLAGHGACLLLRARAIPRLRLVVADVRSAGKTSDTVPMPIVLVAAWTPGRGRFDDQECVAQGMVDVSYSWDVSLLLRLSSRPWATGGLAMRAPCVTARRRIRARARESSQCMPILGRRRSEAPA